jgi:hypothetical protein
VNLKDRENGRPSVRERLEQRLVRCARCADGLLIRAENSTRSARRTKSEATPIDASAALPAIAVEGEGPRSCSAAGIDLSVVIENCSHALGRGLDYYDFPTVRKIGDGVQGLSLVVHIRHRDRRFR